MNKICIVEPSSAGLELVTSAKNMGLETLVFSANRDERVIPDKYRHHIDQLIEIDTYDIHLMHASIEKINLLSPLSAIIPGSEYHVPIAAQLSYMLGLPGVSPKNVDKLRVKNKMRECLEENGLRCPRFKVVNDKDELEIASKYVGFPCVLKPAASAGSVHVSRNNSLEELIFSYQQMCVDPWTELGKGIGNIALLEEYISGDEFSVEGYIEKTKINILSITKKFLFPEPYFVEMGHIVPANVSEKTQKSISEYVQNIINALGINLGIFHCELRFDRQGPVLMEIAGRLPGDRICDLIKIARKIDLCEIMILSHMGKDIHFDHAYPLRFAGIRYFALDNQKIFNQIAGIEKLQLLPGFCEFNLLKAPGEIIPTLKDFSGRVAAAIFAATTYEELESTLNLAASLISFS